MNEVGADEMIDYYVWDSVLEFSSKQLPFIFLSKRTITIHMKTIWRKIEKKYFWKRNEGYSRILSRFYLDMCFSMNIF